ncbi:MAG: DNA recombination protein RmuC, partial [Muribaculaceae bacterium]|nr:DNA recombination protein RmuC [Muribaculaceae bacterium]
MEIIITAILAALAGATFAALICRARASASKGMLSAEIENAARRLAELKENYNREIQSLKESYERLDSQRRTQIEDERNAADRRMADADRQWQLRFDRLKEEILNINNRILIARQEKLQSINRIQIAELLTPIKEQFAAFKKSVEETRTAGEVSKEELKNSFEANMKLFAQQQDMAVKSMREQTEKIGNEAQN